MPFFPYLGRPPTIFAVSSILIISFKPSKMIPSKYSSQTNTQALPLSFKTSLMLIITVKSTSSLIFPLSIKMPPPLNLISMFKI